MKTEFLKYLKKPDVGSLSHLSKLTGFIVNKIFRA